MQDARLMQARALELLSAGDVRDVVGKAWCATKRATDALILAPKGNTLGQVETGSCRAASARRAGKYRYASSGPGWSSG